VVTERRQAVRHDYKEGVLPPRVRLRPFMPVIVVNLSRTGVLVEGATPLRPGSLIEVRLQLAGGVMCVNGEVARSFVASIRCQAGIRYRAAIAFALPIHVVPPRDLLRGYQLPAS
jgi:hypothetical protein